ncbi:hypothetical protein, partial [Methanothrix sp.]|uniref:hypothetical protein n=2 Tax=Methanothrix sp. TaxID=90426 RepID=UPI003BAF332C
LPYPMHELPCLALLGPKSNPFISSCPLPCLFPCLFLCIPPMKIGSDDPVNCRTRNGVACRKRLACYNWRIDRQPAMIRTVEGNDASGCIQISIDLEIDENDGLETEGMVSICRHRCSLNPFRNGISWIEFDQELQHNICQC